MPHSTNLIKKINIGGTIYNIHDEHAIHSLANLDLTGYLQYKGTVSTVSGLPATGNAGDVYHVIDIDSEYIWVGAVENGEATHWGIIGYISGISTYEICGTENVKVDNRIWIKSR